MPGSVLNFYATRTEAYLRERLLPFWIERSPDPGHGGFLSYFDRHGKPTGETTKTLLMQARLLFTFARAHRAGYGGGRCAELARAAADFLLEHYWDREHGGWYWIADRDGRPVCQSKIGYGQCFAMYAFAEHVLATGDARSREAMERTYAAIMAHMADARHGGYLEILHRDWQPELPGRRGGDRKSLDVHMHMMEALTSVCAVTGHPTHRRRLEEVIALLLEKMLDPEHGTGRMQFALDWTPLAAIRFEGAAWGSDQEPDQGAFPLQWTSWGHNVELAWLLLQAADVLGQPRQRYAEVVRRICDNCLAFGIDWEKGGVFIDGLPDRPPLDTKKQFWQQAEVLVGMLDAYLLLGDRRCWDAFANVHDFVFGKMVAWEAGGEWYAMVDRDGAPVWDYLGHQWKISYHTVRSMIEVGTRLRALVEDA